MIRYIEDAYYIIDEIIKHEIQKNLKRGKLKK